MICVRSQGLRWGAVVLAGCSLTSVGLGQTAPAQAVTQMFKLFRAYDLFPIIPQIDTNKNPLESSTFANSGPIAPVNPLAGQEDRELHLIQGGNSSSFKDNILTIVGPVKGTFRGYTFSGKRVTINRITQVFILQDDAELIGSGATVRADEIIVDFVHQSYQAFASNADLKPSLVGGQLLDDAYTHGQSARGDSKESFVAFGDITTCDLQKPHYDIRARSIDIRYGRRITLRHVTVDLLGKKLFSLPFLSLPLDDRTYQNLPVFGQNPVEGYYMKTNYGIPLRGDNTLLTREDYMSKLGIGLGATYLYQNLKGLHQYAGDIGFYGVTGSRTLDITADDAIGLGFGKLQINGTYQNDDYLVAPQSKILNTRALLSVPDRYGVSSFGWNLSENASPGFQSNQQTFSLSESQNFGFKYGLNSNITYNDSSSNYTNGSGNNFVDNRSVNVGFTATDDLKEATASLNYQKTIPVGTIQNFFTGTQAAPELSLTSTSTKLFGREFGANYPFQVQASIGEYGDPNSGGDITRDYFAFNFNRQLQDHGNHNSLNITSQFAQGIYSDDTAQYKLGLGLAYTHPLGKDTNFNLSYNYLRPEGFTPLGIDSSGKLNLASMGLTIRPMSDLLFGVQTGYDAIQLEQHQTPWQVVSFRTEYNVGTWFLVRSLATYDPFVKSWANIRFDFSYKPGATFVGLSARYDAINHVWGSLNGFVQALKWGRAKIDLLAAFNGFSGRIQSEQINLVYDLHCAEAVLQVVNNQTGFQNGLSLAFFIRLKALPFGSIFGAGTRGQPIGLGTGIGY